MHTTSTQVPFPAGYFLKCQIVQFNSEKKFFDRGISLSLKVLTIYKNLFCGYLFLEFTPNMIYSKLFYTCFFKFSIKKISVNKIGKLFYVFGFFNISEVFVYP